MKLLSFIFILFFSINLVNGQGCVAVRGGSCAGTIGNNFNLLKNDVFVQTNFRYFRSFRHFRGSTQEKHRLEEGTEVINKSFLYDFLLSYGISDRIYGTLVVPFVHYDRSSMYEHGGNPPNGLGERHETSSSGLSDIRLSLGYWLFDPEKSFRSNYSVALGVKLPTGKYDYKDTFYNQGPDRNQEIESVVDQSIQPGDGGTGLTFELQGFQALSEKFFLNANVYYLFNVQATNGVLTRNGRSEFSCPDQFAFRLGTTYVSDIKGWTAFLGGRAEGVPSQDLIGKSTGYRRPGYIISVEPGLNFTKNNFSFNLNVPIALVRSRTQSFEDIERTKETGVFTNGDAAFADYLINFGVSYLIGKKHKMDAINAPLWNDIQEKQ